MGENLILYGAIAVLALGIVSTALALLRKFAKWIISVGVILLLIRLASGGGLMAPELPAGIPQQLAGIYTQAKAVDAEIRLEDGQIKLKTSSFSSRIIPQDGRYVAKIWYPEGEQSTALNMVSTVFGTKIRENIYNSVGGQVVPGFKYSVSKTGLVEVTVPLT